ncbi:hypothetical protein [Thermobifida halotolerans]|uniref:hypothetical protein n=1 Tax=Thermobifida halotolerans TaxID=483545 RepID=UPI000A76CC4E|nr:hypothetical protein [Thermobifida halotolerans]
MGVLADGPDSRTGPRSGGGGPVVAAQVLVVCLLAVLVGRLWYLQVPMGEHYRTLAEGNRVQAVAAPATRGQTLDVRTGGESSTQASTVRPGGTVRLLDE